MDKSFLLLFFKKEALASFDFPPQQETKNRRRKQAAVHGLSVVLTAIPFGW
jgi:hypothetical protein